MEHVTATAPRRSGITIRPVERADLLDVARIERASFPEPWPHRAFERFVDEPTFLVAVRPDDRIVGFVVGDLSQRYGVRIGHIKDIAVHPEARGAGVGATLLEQCLRALEVRGADSVKLEVRPSNEAARSLYESQGFQLHKRVTGYYTDGEDALVLVRET